MCLFCVLCKLEVGPIERKDVLFEGRQNIYFMR